MKTIHSLAVLGLFLACVNQSFGLISIGLVTTERAEALGIEVRAKPGGPTHAWVELEFKPEGKLAKFRHVSLEIADGDQLGLGWTPLKEERTSSGSVIVRVMGSRAFLERVTLRIVHGDFAATGEDVQLKDFVDFEKLDKPGFSSRSKHGEEGGSEQPAASDEAAQE